MHQVVRTIHHGVLALLCPVTGRAWQYNGQAHCSQCGRHL